MKGGGPLVAKWACGQGGLKAQVIIYLPLLELLLELSVISFYFGERKRYK
jgi:hypothetical protein